MSVEDISIGGTGAFWWIRVTCTTCSERITVVWEQLAEGIPVKCSSGHLQPSDLAPVFEVPDDGDQEGPAL